jgi:tetratricopeptide (TPR) repeat protein
MKILILLLSSSLFLSTFTATPYQEEESPELKEASELSNSVIKLVNEQKIDEALPLAKRALQIREKLLPRTDPRVQASLQRLGDLYLVRREYVSARQTFERLLKILEEHYGPTAWNLGGTLDRLAVVHYRLGNMSKAEDMYQRAVEVREKASGPEDVKVAEPLFALAQFQRLRKDYDRALLSYKRVLSIYAKNKAFSAAGFQRASNGFYCLAYESNNPDVYKELEQTRSPFSQEVFWDEAPRIINGKALSLPKPEYPQGARDYSLSGKVYVLVEIDETGKVISATDMCGGPPFLSESSVKAAWKSTFTPTKVAGKPVKVKGLIQYNFVRQ